MGFRELARDHGGLTHAHNQLVEGFRRLYVEHQQTRTVVAGFIRRGFWSRFRWLLFGEPAPRVQTPDLEVRKVDEEAETQEVQS